MLTGLHFIYKTSIYLQTRTIIAKFGNKDWYSVFQKKRRENEEVKKYQDNIVEVFL